ncbi:Quinohemoprotein amine dehydrogenase A, alpha subunit, heme binding [Pseudovibrio axinellae]|uniref:Quinohemoprotein amine dehydrogenase A, alpha subunit, heme binding n=1 Tax=Pseudovibrio axinellae TaxID=989403 RepID=A0A165ZHC8_9HYPH|nr:quinohemoprotein amine dehydrogenase subunit alpha [Pseudovibrio axinellae]KZL19901.1 Quinohemoprotein amine dehydrogenase A, alpha subunit, heme binding [Pseudovibrio axinellae]SER37745.1 quinohemoprotein amine dehydrogenase [Pseudovibrio axinellae]
MRATTFQVSAVALLLFTTGTAANADEQLLDQACNGCHSETSNGLSRIDGQRKTPEGWLMTIVRMRQIHGMELSNKDQATLVGYLSDTQGLAPSEAAAYRYVLERDPDIQESFEEPFASMCTRCHTGARVGLQRRSEEEWLLHMDFHVGQFPTIEYQALGRDRQWYEIAKTNIAPALAERFPLETEAWKTWQSAPKVAVDGDWVVLTELPGLGQAYGTFSVTGSSSPHKIEGNITLSDGTEHTVSGRMNFYTGYEWRANVKINGKTYRQILAMSEDGKHLKGRQFLRSKDSLGARFTGVKKGQGPAIIGTVPAALPAGQNTLQFVGTELENLSLSDASDSAIMGSASTNNAGASLSLQTTGNGQLTLEADNVGYKLSHYDSIDRLVVEPAFTIARVGGGSDVGPDRVPARFKAIGYWNGPDGEPGTQDDVRIGEVPATWSMSNHNEAAADMGDAKFAGYLDQTGIFTPAVAGPNAERRFSTNNAGDLKISAEAMGLKAESQLIVTVQRFVDPPIR